MELMAVGIGIVFIIVGFLLGASIYNFLIRIRLGRGYEFNQKYRVKGYNGYYFPVKGIKRNMFVLSLVVLIIFIYVINLYFHSVYYILAFSIPYILMVSIMKSIDAKICRYDI